MSPGALNETQTLEGQYQGTEQQIGYAKAAKNRRKGDCMSQSRGERRKIKRER